MPAAILAGVLPSAAPFWLAPVNELDGACFSRGNLVKSIPGIGITDPIAILRVLFSGQEILCKDAADVDDDGEIAIADGAAVRAHRHLLRPLMEGPS